ncbi:MAG: glycosyltransferase family 4 protein [Candidatus Nanoarchaeia archaeon]|nr:glycosyltransferase family 4 protein [Candidatus Nanoarchaeia archaeon]
MTNVLLMVNDMVIPNKGGGAPRVYAVARAFDRLDYDCYLFCPIEISEEEAKHKTGINFVKMKYINRHDPKKIIKYAMYNPFLFFRTLRLAKKHKINLIFAHNALCGFPAVLAGKILKIPVVFDPTDFVAEFVKDSADKFSKRLMFRIASFFERWTMKRADHIISNTKFIKSYLEEKYKRKIDVVYDGVDLDVFYPSRKRKDNKFVMIIQGGMDPQDGLDILVPCVEKIADKIKNFECWVVGDGKMLPILKEQVENKGLNKRFKFTGWVSQDEVRQYMSDADLGLVILPDKLSGKIRITLRTFEYWACNIPIIAPNLTSIKEVVRDKENGLLYKVGDANDLADKILMLYDSNKLREKIRKNGFIDSKNFDDDVLADEIVSICERTLL